MIMRSKRTADGQENEDQRDHNFHTERIFICSLDFREDRLETFHKDDRFLWIWE